MSPSANARRLPRHPAVWWSRINFRWPFLVWLGAILGATWLFLSAGQYETLSGVVEVIHENAAPVEAGRLLRVSVQAGQPVNPGDVLAQLDTAALEAEIAVLQSEMAVERMQVERQFTVAVDDAESALRDARMRMASDQGQLDVLNLELKRMDELLASRLIDAQTVSRFRIQREMLAKSVEFYPETIRALETRLADARAKQTAVMASVAAGQTASVAVASAFLSNTVGQAHQQRVNLLDLRRENCTIRARRAGVVSRILREPGDVIAAGDPIVTVVIKDAQRFIGFVPEWRVRDWDTGDQARVFRRSDPSVMFPARVISVAPDIMALPGRVSPIQGQSIRGRRVVLVPDQPVDMIPGEEVIIDVDTSWWQALLNRYGLGSSNLPAHTP